MKVLTVKQPWASLIINGDKDIENRSWRTMYRGPLYIHSALKPVAAGELAKDLLHGYVLGTVELIDVVRDHDSVWAERGQWHWVLANPQPLAEPYAEKGALGLWELPA